MEKFVNVKIDTIVGKKRCVIDRVPTSYDGHAINTELVTYSSSLISSHFQIWSHCIVVSRDNYWPWRQNNDFIRWIGINLGIDFSGQVIQVESGRSGKEKCFSLRRMPLHIKDAVKLLQILLVVKGKARYWIALKYKKRIIHKQCNQSKRRHFHFIIRCLIEIPSYNRVKLAPICVYRKVVHLVWAKFQLFWTILQVVYVQNI